MDIDLNSEPLYTGATLETVGIRDASSPETALAANKFYRVFEENSVYKVQEFVLDNRGTTNDASDDYFTQQGSKFNAHAVNNDMSGTINTLQNTPLDAHAPSQAPNLYEAKL